MNVFLINYILMLIEAVILLYKPQSDPLISKEHVQSKKKWFVILQCVQWILISGLRSNDVGADTLNYAMMFESHAQLSWQDCFEYFKIYYIEGVQLFEYEPGYILFEKIISSIWANQVFYKFCVATIFMSALGYFVYKNSDDPFIAFLLYTGLFYNMFSLTGYRQVISVSIGILWSYKYLKQRKFWKFLLLVLIGALLHKSTLVFIIFYFVSRKKITAIYASAAIMIIIGMILFRTQLFDFIKVLVGYDEYGMAGKFTQRNFLFFFAILAILSIWRYSYIKETCPESDMYYNGLILSAAMIPFAMVSPTSMRLVYDFAFMLMILLPKVYKSFTDSKDRLIAYSCSILVFGFFVAVKAIPYEFFWQGI